MTITEDLEPFSCPRCGQTVQERFWGPCAACRAELVAAHRSADSAPLAEAETARFEPAMHVVPNHVATKD
jgi:hypothetical protein